MRIVSPGWEILTKDSGLCFGKKEEQFPYWLKNICSKAEKTI